LLDISTLVVRVFFCLRIFFNRGHVNVHTGVEDLSHGGFPVDA